MSNNYQLPEQQPLQIGQINIEVAETEQITGVSSAVLSVWQHWDKERKPSKKALEIRERIANNWA